MPTNSYIYSVSRMTDAELDNLLSAVMEEKSKRQEEIRKLRAQWISDFYCMYMAHPNASHRRIGDITVVSFYHRHSGIHMGTARPIKGDVFNERTGIAVAFAKANGYGVPDYI